MKFSSATNSQLIASRGLLRNPYAYLNDVGKLDGLVTADQLSVNHGSMNPYANIGENDGLILTEYNKIASKAREAHKLIWCNRSDIWPEGVPKDLIKMLDPAIAIQLLEYSYEEVDYVADFKRKESDRNIAGVLDRVRKRVRISDKLQSSVRQFTVAHELGHILLHESVTMHRDRPIDGSHQARDMIELEADKFASLFLMPEKLVKERFSQNYGDREPFIIDEDLAFALDPQNAHSLYEDCKCLRDLSRILAKAKHFNRRHFPSLSEQFGVSVEAMAIRLEELELVVF